MCPEAMQPQDLQQQACGPTQRLLHKAPDLTLTAATLQLLQGVAHLHSRWVFHRDIKMSNLLMTGSGRLKICDFGLARYFHAEAGFAYTPKVVTLWYR